MRILLILLLCSTILIGAAERANCVDLVSGDLVTTKVIETDAVVSRSFSGSVLSEQNAVLSSKLMGQIVAVHASEGDILKAGDPILDLDSREQALRVQSLEQQSVQAAGEVEGVSGRLDYAKKNAERLALLAQQGNVARDESDRAQTEYSTLQNQVVSAKARKASLDAQLKESQTLLGYASIKAPYHCILTRRHVDVGAFVQSGQPLAAIDDVRGGVKAEAEVDESLMKKTKVGDVALLLIPTDKGDVPILSPGVISVVPFIDPMSRSFRVQVALPGECFSSGSLPLASGAFVRIILATGTEHRVLVSPKAVFVRNGQTVAYVVNEKGDKLLRLIKTGASYRRGNYAGRDWIFDTRDVVREDMREMPDDRLIEVLSGLSGNETVVLQ